MRQWRQTFPAALVAGFLIVGALAVGVRNAGAEENGVDQKPVLGWSSWSFIREQPTAAKLEAQAHALQASGLQQLGYTYVNLDDFWYQCPGPQGPNVDSYGRWVIDTSRFPPQGDTNGIQAVADAMHGLGMKFGIYVTPGISRQAVAKKTAIKGTSYTADQIAEPSVTEANYNCKGMVRIDYSKPGAQAFINSWVDMLASWGVDYIKIDGMSNNNVPDIKAWSEAMRQSGRPMVLDVTQGSYTRVIAPTLMKYANQWEFAPDVECYKCEKKGSSYPLTSWKDVEKRFNYVADWHYSLRKALYKLRSGTPAARRSFALLASLPEVIRVHPRVPRLSLPDDPHCVCYPDRTPDRPADWPLPDRKAARISDRPIHPRGWSQGSPEKSRHSNDGRVAHLRGDSGAYIIVE